MNDILSRLDLEHYKGRVAVVQGLGHSAIFVNVQALDQMLKEIEANRLTIEKLAEKCGQLREK